jgi:hypothetical protein
MINTIINNIQLPIFKYEVDNHKTIKPLILKDIKEMGTYSYINEGQRITNTDWHLDREFNRCYFTHVEPHVSKLCNELRSTLNHTGKIHLVNYWFQQYERGDYHTWHYHTGCMFSAIYYVNLQGDNPKTSFRLGKKEFDIDVKEAEILIFPSFLNHTSKENKSDYTKIVVPFNLNY